MLTLALLSSETTLKNALKKTYLPIKPNAYKAIKKTL